MVQTINNIKVKGVKSQWDVFFDMALEMLDTIMENNKLGKKTVMIVPVGPTAQYPILARLVNQLHVSLKDVYFFNMDEYLVSPDKAIDPNDPLSFHKRMNDEFYSLVSPELVMPESQRFFPAPGKEKEYDELIEKLGGADLCLGGLGINGHVAFNEPPEEDDPITKDEFAALGTRVLRITRETRTINANGYLKGDIAAMPKWCITVGMKQILASKKIYIALNVAWQQGIFKRVLFDEICPQRPSSLLREHGDVTFCMTDEFVGALK